MKNLLKNVDRVYQIKLDDVRGLNYKVAAIGKNGIVEINDISIDADSIIIDPNAKGRYLISLHDKNYLLFIPE